MERIERPGFRVDVIAGVVHYTASPAPEISLAEGAALAEESLAMHRALAGRDGVIGIIVDLRRLRSMPGPRTREATAAIMQVWERAGRRAAVLPGAHPAHAMMMARLLREHGPRQGRVVPSLSHARAWVGAGIEPDAVALDLPGGRGAGPRHPPGD